MSFLSLPCKMTYPLPFIFSRSHFFRCLKQKMKRVYAPSWYVDRSHSSHQFWFPPKLTVHLTQSYRFSQDTHRKDHYLQGRVSQHHWQHKCQGSAQGGVSHQHESSCHSSHVPHSISPNQQCLIFVTIFFLSHVFFLVSLVQYPYFRFAPSYEETDHYLLAFPSYSSSLIIPL